jgi:NADPH-dependent 7-cyano-7-deazaguanine reductase QueF-like protein
MAWLSLLGNIRTDLTGCLLSQSPVQARLEALFGQFAARDFSSALGLALTLDGEGVRDPMLATLLAHLGLLCGQGQAFELGLARLDDLIAQMPDFAQQTQAYDETFVSGQVVGAFGRGDGRMVLALLELSRRLHPGIAQAFPQSVATMIARSPLANLGMVDRAISQKPLDGAPVRTRRVNLYLNPWFFGPGGRVHDLGPRMARAFSANHWPTNLLAPTYHDQDLIELAPDELFAHLSQGAPDLILFDNQRCRIRPETFSLVSARLRVQNPDIKFGLLLFDPWIVDFWADLRTFSPMVDVIWTPSFSAPVLQEADIADKTFFMTYPVGVGLDELASPPRERMVAFQGAVEWYNYARAYWLTLLDKAGAPVRGVVTRHVDDGLDPIESFKLYLNGFRSVEGLLNLSMRKDGSRMATGRSFEAIYTGACLFQEQADDMAQFGFREGFHYLGFTRFDDLMDRLAFVVANPDAMQQIAQQGQAFYQEKFMDSQIINALGRRL